MDMPSIKQANCNEIALPHGSMKEIIAACDRFWAKRGRKDPGAFPDHYEAYGKAKNPRPNNKTTPAN